MGLNSVFFSFGALKKKINRKSINIISDKGKGTMNNELIFNNN
jgi:hypothetical protein